jgi:DNA-binding transcriptional LysR family regulator
MSEALRRDAAGGLLKLGSVHTCVSGVLPLALKQLREQGRGFDVNLTTGLTHELERAVYRRQLDAAITTQPEMVRPELQFEAFADEPFVVITHRDTPAATDRKILESTPYVRFNRAARVGALVHDALARRKIVVRSVMEIDTLEGVMAMVASGLGSSIVPSRALENDFPPSIRAVPFGAPPLTRRLGLLSSRGNPRTHLCEQLLEALRTVSGRRKAAGIRRRA